MRDDLEIEPRRHTFEPSAGPEAGLAVLAAPKVNPLAVTFAMFELVFSFVATPFSFPARDGTRSEESEPQDEGSVVRCTGTRSGPNCCLGRLSALLTLDASASTVQLHGPNSLASGCERHVGASGPVRDAGSFRNVQEEVQVRAAWALRDALSFLVG
jgi:hypothetical protein